MENKRKKPTGKDFTDKVAQKATQLLPEKGKQEILPRNGHPKDAPPAKLSHPGMVVLCAKMRAAGDEQWHSVEEAPVENPADLVPEFKRIAGVVKQTHQAEAYLHISSFAPFRKKENRELLDFLYNSGIDFEFEDYPSLHNREQLKVIIEFLRWQTPKEHEAHPESALRGRNKTNQKLGQAETIELSRKKKRQIAFFDESSRKARLFAVKLRRQGNSLHEIAKRLNDSGLLTTRGNSFHAKQVSRLLEAHEELLSLFEVAPNEHVLLGGANSGRDPHTTLPEPYPGLYKGQAQPSKFLDVAAPSNQAALQAIQAPDLGRSFQVIPININTKDGKLHCDKLIFLPVSEVLQTPLEVILMNNSGFIAYNEVLTAPVSEIRINILEDTFICPGQHYLRLKAGGFADRNFSVVIGRYLIEDRGLEEEEKA